MNLNEPFLNKIVPIVVETMGDMFPELKKNPQHVIDIVKDEEISFSKTLDRGIELFEEAFRRAITLVSPARATSNTDPPSLNFGREIDICVEGLD